MKRIYTLLTPDPQPDDVNDVPLLVLKFKFSVYQQARVRVLDEAASQFCDLRDVTEMSLLNGWVAGM